MLIVSLSLIILLFLIPVSILMCLVVTVVLITVVIVLPFVIGCLLGGVLVGVAGVALLARLNPLSYPHSLKLCKCVVSLFCPTLLMVQAVVVALIGVLW